MLIQHCWSIEKFSEGKLNWKVLISHFELFNFQKYYLALKEKDVVERNLINDIFYKIPEIHVHHELLLSALESKLEAWDSRQTVGDLLFNIVSFFQMLSIVFF